MPAKATMNNYMALKLFALLNIKAKLRVNKQIPNADANIVYFFENGTKLKIYSDI